MTTLPEVATNPTVGVTIFVFGGLAGAVFYLPLKRVRQWAWESYWMLWAAFALVIVPLILAFATSPNWLSVLRQAPPREILYCYLCGAAWGLGGLTWGLMIRYLGVGLGLALGCGLCSAAGTVVPPMLKGQFIELFHTPSGRASLAAAAVSLLGIALVGAAGMSKEKELPGGAEEEGSGGIQLQEGHHDRRLFRHHERGNELRPARRARHPEAGRGDITVHCPGLAGHAGAGGRAARRLYGQRPVVPVPQRQEQDLWRLCQEGCPCPRQSLLRRNRRSHLDLPVHRLQDRRTRHGQPELRRLGRADGEPRSCSAAFSA